MKMRCRVCGQRIRGKPLDGCCDQECFDQLASGYQELGKLEEQVYRLAEVVEEMQSQLATKMTGWSPVVHTPSMKK